MIFFREVIRDRLFHNYSAENPSIDELYVAEKRRSTDFNALKLWKGRSGMQDMQRRGRHVIHHVGVTTYWACKLWFFPLNGRELGAFPVRSVLLLNLKGTYSSYSPNFNSSDHRSGKMFTILEPQNHEIGRTPCDGFWCSKVVEGSVSWPKGNKRHSSFSTFFSRIRAPFLRNIENAKQTELTNSTIHFKTKYMPQNILLFVGWIILTHHIFLIVMKGYLLRRQSKKRENWKKKQIWFISLFCT